MNKIEIKPIEIRPVGKNNIKFTTRYISPPPVYDIEECFLKYKKAEDLASNLDIKKNSRYFVLVDGLFYFGDFIEALAVKNNWLIKTMTISTLSMNENNIDSLKNLITGDYIQELQLIVSDYFYSHERNGLIKYIYEQLDIDDKFQLAVAGSHCKLCFFETNCGLQIIIHGSANLRSSGNIEQIVVEESNALYLFLKNSHDPIIEKYKTIKKSLRRKTLWQAVQN